MGPTFHLTRAELWLGVSILLYFLLNGAQLSETLVFVPKWVSDPPTRFGLLTDGRGVSLKTFWIVFHSIHEITFILALVFCWQLAPVRNGLLVLFAIHFAVRVWTILYFAPNIIRFQSIAPDSVPTAELAAKTALWQTLNYVRVSIYLAVSLGLIPLWLHLFSLRNK